MEYEKIQKLMEDMGNSNLSSLQIDFPDGTKISMQKDNSEKEAVHYVKEKTKSVEKETKPEIEEEKEEEGNIVTSPMVGTFYAKPDPDAIPYVTVGKEVKKGDILCIVEAMKLMNEIESDYTGTIQKIFVKDGEPVEYGTKLFEIK